MKLATWNVNSVRARLELLLRWLRDERPDVVCLQELKAEVVALPLMELQALGYHCAAVGQKSYNGVAILTLQDAPELRLQALPNNQDDPQARYLEIAWRGWIIGCLYAPNGNPVASDKFAYKLRWLELLRQHAATLLTLEQPVILAGDYNIIPEEQDVYDPVLWAEDALFKPESRALWRRYLGLGYVDALRALHPALPHAYSFWDYQQGAWLRDLGIRIDHLLLSPEAADRLRACQIDRTPRGWDKASDHTPVVAEFK
jgi:exodeoxyribonuclease III